MYKFVQILGYLVKIYQNFQIMGIFMTQYDFFMSKFWVFMSKFSFYV